MSGKVIIRCVADLEEYRGGGAPSLVDFVHGEFAVDALGRATAEEMLAALTGSIGAESAKAIVQQLLDHDLLYDATIESELRDAR